MIHSGVVITGMVTDTLIGAAIMAVDIGVTTEEAVHQEEVSTLTTVVSQIKTEIIQDSEQEVQDSDKEIIIPASDKEVVALDKGKEASDKEVTIAEVSDKETAM
jgi:hypothetical protein